MKRIYTKLKHLIPWGSQPTARPDTPTPDTQNAPPPLTERQRHAVEAILDDERLTRDLTDDQAQPLIEWATARVSQAAADTTRSDNDIEQCIAAIRHAVRTVGKTASSEHTPEQLVSLAEETLEKDTLDHA